jgi:hypothetical protein
MVEADRQAKTSLQEAFSHHFFYRPRRHRFSLSQEQGMRRRGRQLLEGMADMDRRRRVRRASEGRESKNEGLPPREVDAGARFVEEQKRVFHEQGAGEQDPLALALGTRPESTIDQSGTAERSKDLRSANPIGLIR